VRSRYLVLGLAASLGLFGCKASNVSNPSIDRVDVPAGTVKIDHVSNRMLVLSLHEALQRRDYGAMVESVEPDFRSQFRTMLNASREYIESLYDLSKLVRDRIGPVPAQRYPRLAEEVYEGMLPDPLQGAIDNGQVDWNQVQFLDQGFVTIVRIKDHESAFTSQFAIKEIKGKWYLTPYREGMPEDKRKVAYDRESKFVQKQFRDYVQIVKDMQKKVKSGQIATEDQLRDDLNSGTAATETPAKPKE
jgi:hypothetical protein